MAWPLTPQALEWTGNQGTRRRMDNTNENTSGSQPQKLSQADQARVDGFLARGVNATERKPFRPIVLIFLLMAVVAGFSLLSQGIAKWSGIY